MTRSGATEPHLDHSDHKQCPVFSMNRQLLSNFLLQLALCQVFLLCASATKLPSLWKADPRTHPDGFYRFFYRLEIINNSDPSQYKSYLIEEWANLRVAKFRFDIVALHEGKRRTVLYYGDTDEVFHYEPFRCYSDEYFNQALYSELIDIFPESKESFMRFGIGSLWKYAENKSSYDAIVKLDSYIPLEYSSRSTRLNYQTTRDYENELTFFMGDTNNVDTLSLILIGNKYKLRILETPKDLRQQRDRIEAVFHLPKGYGCKPAKSDENGIYPKPLQFMSLNPDELRLLRLDFVASRPIDGSSYGGTTYDVPDRWRSHSSSIRMLSGGYQSPSGDYERNYMIFEKQESSSDRRSVSQYLAGIASSRRASTRRTKTVWDMSNLGSNTRSRFFELDMTEGKCLGYGEANTPLDVGIELAIAPASTDFEDDSPPLTLALGIELLGVLFSPDGFVLISHQEYVLEDKLTFEKRDDNFKMKNIHGMVVWEGVVSIIRQVTVPKIQLTNKSTTESASKERHVFTINFYSKKATKLLARVKLIVAELRTIDQHYLLDEINVGTCLIRVGSSSRGVAGADFMDELLNEQQLDENLAFELEYYPLDMELYEKYAATQQVSALKKKIELEFIRSLVELSGYRLDLMQIFALNIDIRQAGTSGDESSYSVRVSGQLLERPSLLNFIRDPGYKFTDGSSPKDKPEAAVANQQVRSLLKDSAKSCAASCDHFNCTKFTHCASSGACDLLMAADTSQPGIKMSWDPNCVLYTRHDQARSIISPHELIHQIGQMIRAQQEQSSNKQVSPLHLKLDFVPSPILLVPESIESSLLHGQEFEELAELEDGDETQMIVSAVKPSLQIRQEYSALIYDKRYKSHLSDRISFPLPEANHMSHHECESLCKQNDCMSFSYCRLERLCQISSLHRRTQIEQMIEQDSGCVLMTREYLSKFAKISREPQQPRKTFETIRAVEDLSDCATSCMERDSPKCCSFYYCPSESGRASCHLKSSNMVEEPATDDTVRATTEGNSSVSCDLYARSHLSEFDKFYGKSLPFPDLKTTASIHRGSEAESCASECADKAGGCVGFQVCSLAGGNMGDFVCTTFSTGINSSIASRLEQDPSCTFFLASPGSELHQLATNKLADRIEAAKIAAKEAALHPEESSQVVPPKEGTKKLSSLAVWLLRILFIAIGSMVGYGVVYVSRRSTLMRSSVGQLPRRRTRF